MTTVKSKAKDISSKAKAVKHPAKSAAHKITENVPTVTSDKKISDARKLILENIKEFNTINYIYVVNKNKKLKGVLSLKEVFEKKPKTKIKKAMIKDVVKAHPKTNQERLAHLALKHNLKSIPVVDDKNKFLGAVPSDEILSILNKEAQEDFLRFTGIIPSKEFLKSSIDSPVIDASVRRAPWILIGILGGLLTASIISQFEGILSKHIILASFMPLVAYIANAVGTQTQTLLIRDMAVNSKLPITKYAGKQAVTSVLIGIIAWITVFLVASYFWQAAFVGFVVGLSVFAAILVATFFAIFIPTVLIRLDMDPAIGSGPFTTIVQDLLSIVIYFSIASTLL